MRHPLVLGLLLTASSCTVVEQPSGLIARYTTAYKEAISEGDRARLRDWRKTFVGALAAARAAGHAADIAREGVLLEPDAALAGPAIPNGMYRCRVIKLAARDAGDHDYAASGPFTCRVRQDAASNASVSSAAHSAMSA